jgi:TolB-like protein
MGANRSAADVSPMNADFGPVELARAAPFALGSLEVRPATCEVIAGVTREVLQPRIMQVLVALARRGGDVISRDDLIRECWDGQIVGDDAIQRCIAHLRQVGQAHGAFEITTIPRVGYRLDTAGSAAPPPPPAAPVLAVLPFENLSSDAEMQFFSDGVSEEVLAAAARIEGVRVIGRASSFQLRGAAKSMARAVADLRASHVLDGAVRRSGGRVRISAHLVEAAGQTTLWSQTYERGLVDVFAIQDEIAAAVAGALKRTFAAAPQAAIDPVALDCFLRARDRCRNNDDRASDGVLALLEEAVARAPAYAPAWALLGRMREMNAYSRNIDIAPAYAAATAAVERALVLDPRCSAALVSRAQMLPSYGRFLERERLFLQACAAAPGDADVMQAMAYFLASVGRSTEALNLAARAYETDPLSVHIVRLYTQLLGAEERYAQAQAVLDDARRHWPDSAALQITRVFLLACARDWARIDALLPAEEAARLSATSLFGARVIAGIAALQAPNAHRGVILQAAQLFAAETGSARIGDIVFLSALGEREAAFALCGQASFERLRQGQGKFDPFDIGPIELFGYERGFHNDPRFVSLCAKLGLVSYWLASDRWPDCAETTPYDFKAACRAASNER